MAVMEAAAQTEEWSVCSQPTHRDEGRRDCRGASEVAGERRGAEFEDLIGI